MILITKCTNCESRIQISTLYESRLDLAKSKGDYLHAYCRKCGVNDKYHVNDFVAKPNKFNLIISLIILLIGGPLILILLWDTLWSISGMYSTLFIGSFILVPSVIYLILNKQDRLKVNAFNGMKI